MKLLTLRRVTAAAALSGLIFFGGSTEAVGQSAGMTAFREAYTAQTTATRVFEQDLALSAPTFHLDIDSRAQVLGDSFRMGGTFTWTYTDLDANSSTNKNIPFYIEQVGNDMTLYVKRRGTWSKMLLPGLPSGIAILWRTNDPAIRNDTLNAVKSVEILSDTPDLRIMNVTLDGAKLADILAKNSAATFANLKGDDLAAHKGIFDRWLTAFRSTDVNFSWSVNKPSLTTATVAFDLTEIMRAYARSVLEESAAGRIVLTDAERKLLDAVGYYSELRAYTTQIAARKDTMVELPADLSAAPENDDSLNDVFLEMTSVVQK